MWMDPLSIVRGELMISQSSMMYGAPGVPFPPDVQLQAAHPLSLLTSIGSWYRSSALTGIMLSGVVRKGARRKIRMRALGLTFQFHHWEKRYSRWASGVSE